MILCEIECANLISKTNFNLIDRTDLFISLHIMFQISIQNSKAQKSYRIVWDVRSELLLSIFYNNVEFGKKYFCAYIRPRYQVSVYRTIGPLVYLVFQ